ncbi:MAG: nickel pincer cofactor biosynthesis protein LarB [Oscillospiraceae bacterium]|nr:nickel pincer cofactor biosynthesis protein LarB [Oscillospiraceae bacterium]
MEQDELLRLLESVRSGETEPSDALLKLKKAPFEELGYAKIDSHRGLRQGIGEVIFGLGKTPEQIIGIVRAMLENGRENILITRVGEAAAEKLAVLPGLEYHAAARLAVVNRAAGREPLGSVVVASGGTSDFPVCEEAALTAEALGSKVTRLYDVGVAGLHRLLAHSDALMTARAIVAVAGMEGALASVIGGLVDCPVIAVPTSIGYGASFGGVAALLSMLNSCASGVSVVNIDNGFGAGYLAHMINKMGIDFQCANHV